MTREVAANPSATLRERIGHYADLIRLSRPIGVYLLLWPALWALWIAGDGRPDWVVVVIFILGTFLMRSAGCAVNDYADRDFDGHVARTCRRPVASGRVSPREALAVFAVLALTAFGLVLLLNVETILMSLAAVLLAASYPFMKRFTHFPQVVLGAAFGWAVPMAFTALQRQVPVEGWVLFAVALVWAVIYDTMYAMVDREDDLRIGIKSTAIAFGRYDRLVIGLLQAVMLAMLLWIGLRVERGPAYFAGLGVVAGLFVYHQYLIRARDPKACFTAFLHNNYVGMALFAALVIDYLVWP